MISFHLFPILSICKALNLTSSYCQVIIQLSFCVCMSNTHTEKRTEAGQKLSVELEMMLLETFQLHLLNLPCYTSKSCTLAIGLKHFPVTSTPRAISTFGSPLHRRTCNSLCEFYSNYLPPTPRHTFSLL